MARKAPGAVRAHHPAVTTRHRPGQRFTEVDGLSRRTTEALRRLEAERFGPGRIAGAVRNYRALATSPSTRLYAPADDDCPCCLHLDPLAGRDLLAEVLRALPRGTGGDLRRMVAELDAEFERRTIPDHRRMATASTDAWWRRRLRANE